MIGLVVGKEIAYKPLPFAACDLEHNMVASTRMRWLAAMVSARLAWLLLALCAPAGAALPPTGVVRSTPAIQTSLKDRLEKGLRARRPQEFAFVVQVVELVQTGSLPQTLVDKTFFWARAKRRHPFQYFQWALTLRARMLGVSL